jgi:REP element-mobilizing transposase RayT
MIKFNRKSIRLKNYDYSKNGLYFVTINTFQKKFLFGKVEGNNVNLNALGMNIENFWMKIPEHYPNVILHEFVIMPNHIHGVIEITNKQGKDINYVEKADYQKVISGSLGSIIRGFKISGTKCFRENSDKSTLWQRNYYEHIIRNEKDYKRIVNYIRYNPKNFNKEKMINPMDFIIEEF